MKLVPPTDDGEHGDGVPEAAIYVDTTAVIEDECDIGGDTHVYPFAFVAPGARIGEKCTISQYVHVGPHVTIGDRCKIQNGVQLFEGVTLETDVFVGPGAVFTNVTSPRAHVNRKAEFKPTLVKHGASVGANATVLCGVTIGEYAMIGAGAVVTRDVKPHAIVVGNPASHIGWACECGEKLRDNSTTEQGGATFIIEYQCPRCTTRYVLAGGTLKRVEPNA